MPYNPGDFTPPPAQNPSDVDSGPADPEPQGCLFALSQPPLMFFLALIGALLLLTAVHDLFLL